MKTLKIALMSAALLGTTVSIASAQGGGAPPRGQGPGRQNRMMEMMFHDITLTDAQKAKVDSIVAKYRAEMPAFTPGSQPSEEDRAKRRELQQKQQADIRAVLTKEQQAQFDKNLEQMRQQGGRPPARG